MVCSIVALLALTVPVVAFRYRLRATPAGRWTSTDVWDLVANAAMLVGLVLLGIQQGGAPMGTVPGGLLTLAFVVSVAWLVLKRRDRMEMTGQILTSLMAVLIIASLFDVPGDTGSIQTSPFFVLHFGLIFLGMGGFAVSFALSMLFLIQRRRLKTKQLRGIEKLPSMDVLDRLNVRTQGLGFVALTAGIAMGVFLTLERNSDIRLDDLTVWGSAVVWVWYAAGLHARLVGGWHGRSAAIFGTVGFGAVSLLLAVAAVVAGSWHGA